MRRIDIGFVIILVFLLAERIMNGFYSDPKEAVLSMLITIPGILIGITFHEAAHALASYKLGDPTPKLQGRVTLNPLAHIDWFGLATLILCGFGWGRPVEIDPRNYKKRRLYEIIVSLAGVVMNLFIAVLACVALRFILPHVAYATGGAEIALRMLTYTVTINLVLMIFNLIPVPPLDGFSIITEIFDLRRFSWYEPLYQNGAIILMILIVFNVTSRIISPAVDWLWDLLTTLIIY